jgi:hypothetical protein
MSVAEYRCGPESGRTPSRGHCTACVMTSHLVGGLNATATSSISTRQSLAFGCLSPEPATSRYDFAQGTFALTRARRCAHAWGWLADTVSMWGAGLLLGAARRGIGYITGDLLHHAEHSGAHAGMADLAADEDLRYEAATRRRARGSERSARRRPSFRASHGSTGSSVRSGSR